MAYENSSTRGKHLINVNAAVMVHQNLHLPVVVMFREVHVCGYSTLKFSLRPLNRPEQRL